MSDLVNDYLAGITDLSEIALGDESLSLPVEELVGEAFSHCEESLADYLGVAPAAERENLADIALIIRAIQQSKAAACTRSGELIEALNAWLSRSDFAGVEKPKAMMLAKSAFFLLKVLPEVLKNVPFQWKWLVPSGIEGEVTKLRHLAGAKYQALELIPEVTQVPSDVIAQGVSAQQQLIEILQSAVAEVENKTTGLAERQQALSPQFRVLQQLQSCFKLQDSESLTAFWQAFKDPQSFTELLDVLQTSDAERIGWLKAHAHQTNTSYIPLLTGGAYLWSGTAITVELLTKKYQRIVDSLYDAAVDESMQRLEQTDKLQQLIDNHVLVTYQPLKRELRALLDNLRETPIPNLRSGIQWQEHHEQLKNGVMHTAAIRIQRVRELRANIKAIIEAMVVAKQVLETERDKARQLATYIQRLQQLPQMTYFPLTGIDGSLLNQLCQQLKEIIYDTVVPSPLQDSIEKNDAGIAQFYRQTLLSLTTGIESSTELLETLNEKGGIIRAEALADLETFLAAREGLWEQVIRFISPSYRACMEKLEAVLQAPDFNTIEQVEEVVDVVQQGKAQAFFYARWRLQEISQLNRYGLFAREERAMPQESAECRPEAP